MYRTPPAVDQRTRAKVKFQNFIHRNARPRKNILFVSCNGLKKIRVGNFFCIIFLVKNVRFVHVFMLIGSWEGGKNFRVGIFLNKNLLG